MSSAVQDISSSSGLYPGKLWLETPLIRSTHISALLQSNVYLKLDSLQPAQSFKYRGISYFAQHALRTYGPETHLIIASGGNAGLAAACAAKVLKLRCTVFLPHGVNQSTIDFMTKEGAEVVIHGNYYLQALQGAKEAVAAEAKAVMIPAYDDPILWEGHASMVHEIKQQLPEDVKPDAIFCSVGGAGLIGGIMDGCKAVGWDDVPLVAVETHGSNCFYQSLSLNDGPFVGDVSSRPVPKGTTIELIAEHDVAIAHLASLASKATSLGASSPAAGIVKKALERKGGVKSICITDEMAMQATLNFAGRSFEEFMGSEIAEHATEDHKTLVELACGAAIAPAYKPSVFHRLVPRSTPDKPVTVVLIVCGGFKISLDDVEEYRRIVKADVAAGGTWDVAINGETFPTSKAE